MKKKNLKFNKIMSESLFWLHVGVMISAIFIGVFFSFFYVMLIVIAHRAHIFTFKECILFKLQRKIDKIPEKMTFPQYVSKKILGKEITKRQSYFIDYGLVFSCIFVAGFYTFLI